MPLYEYRCTKCGHEFEMIVTTFDTEAKQECPKCKAEAEFFMGDRKKVKFLFNYMDPTL